MLLILGQETSAEVSIVGGSLSRTVVIVFYVCIVLSTAALCLLMAGMFMYFLLISMCNILNCLKKYMKSGHT